MTTAENKSHRWRPRDYYANIGLIKAGAPGIPVHGLDVNTLTMSFDEDDFLFILGIFLWIMHLIAP